MSEPVQEDFESTWGILELMGHLKLAGRVSSVNQFGVKLIRIDMPTSKTLPDDFMTRFYSPQALYCFTPTTEQIARHAVYQTNPPPYTVSETGLYAMLQARQREPERSPIFDYHNDGEDDAGL